MVSSGVITGLLNMLDGDPNGRLWLLAGLIASGLGRIEAQLIRRCRTSDADTF